MDVVIVESPAKAKTINKYLGSQYQVIASYGHVRDLPPKDGSVRPDDNFAMDWEVDGKAAKNIAAIAKAAKGAKRIYLATDPDREGEAISWHVHEVLREKKVLGDAEVKRVVFHEITKNAVLDAMAQPREIDHALVEAYLARRALDYLVGFTLSPVLWRKLPGSRSAGRVQSVALRLICERETEIEKFTPREYWTIAAEFTTPDGAAFTANLTHVQGKKLDKFDLHNHDAAEAAAAIVRSRAFRVGSIDKSRAKRNPSPPFTTSTLQQEAARKLYFPTKKTMQIAQRLYEGVDIGGETVGLITYMRTDAVNLSLEAVGSLRSLIGERFGKSYVPDSPRLYKTKAKNAQEAHEAIRPTDARRDPDSVARYLDDDQLKLYELIWKRTMACQMESAVLDQVAVDVTAPDGAAVLRATGSTVVFDGFFRLYREGRDDDPEDDESRRLPAMEQGQPLGKGQVASEQHFTQPPPRYSEASLVKRLEELGIGRPSTYASIISVLQDRDYVRLDKRRFVPEDRGRLVTAFLTSFFEHYFEYGFTAGLEEKLDDISEGRIDWRRVLSDFWREFSSAVEGTRELRVKDVLDALDRELGPHFFPAAADGKDPRVCPTCGNGRLSIKLGKFGAFIGCSAYPECRFTRPLTAETSGANGEPAPASDGPVLLGQAPDGQPVTLRKGPYGTYVQLGETVPGAAKKGRGKKKVDPDAPPPPKRTSLPRGMEAASVNLDIALKLLSLPREIGVHPESGEKIVAGIGRFGPYIKHGALFISLKKDDDVLTIGLNRAVALLADSKKQPPQTIGAHPTDGKPITLHKGRFGPYVQHNKLRATLPRGTEAEGLTVETAAAILAAKSGKSPSPAKKSAPKKAAAKTPEPKKPAAKKAAAPKKPAKPVAKKAAK